MTESDKTAFERIFGGRNDRRATTDELQGLLLQIVFALLMIFIMAYFIFVAETKKEREEQVLDLNRQKLVLALEKAVEDRRVKYGLNALMTQGTDGKRVFDADAHILGGGLNLAPAAKTAFSSGSAAAAADYKDEAALRKSWYDEVVASSGVETLTEDEMAWLEREISERVESVRLDARGVQRALAARLQAVLIANPEMFGDVRDANALAEAIKLKSLELVKDVIGTEVLP
ncbi:MAG: hypothetical protein IKV56_03665 [Kiritimatiellae bacterium]|nr:hypothetical protein [Kiritimatiellia bacterium]